MSIEDAKILVADDGHVMTMFIVTTLTRLSVREIGEAVIGKGGLAKLARLPNEV